MITYNDLPDREPKLSVPKLKLGNTYSLDTLADMLIEPHKQLSKDRHLFKRHNERYLFAEKGCGLYQLMDRFIQSKIEGIDE